MITPQGRKPQGRKGKTTMTRAERSEYTYIKNNLKRMEITHGCQLTIRTDAGHEYKQALNDLYVSLDCHPASVRVDTHYFDDKERIIYIKGRTWTDNEGNERSWTELYSKEEQARFEAALN